MRKFISKLRSRTRLSAVLAIIIILGIAVPIAVYAVDDSTYVDITGFYMMKAPTRVVDLNGDRETFSYKYLGIGIYDETEGATTDALLYGFNASSVSGSYVRGATHTYNATMTGGGRKALVFGDNEINATDTGELGVYLPAGCQGTFSNLTSGATAQLSGSTGALVAGWNNITVVKAGNFTVAAYMSYDPLGSLAGQVGEGNGTAYLQLAGPIIYASLTAQSSAIVTGVNTTVHILAPGENFVVVANATTGNLNLTVPYGNYGNFTCSGMQIGGATSGDLRNGVNDFVVTKVNSAGTPGYLTINLHTTGLYQFSGKPSVKKGVVKFISGKLHGFLIKSTDPWNAWMLDFTAKATKYIYDPTEE